MTAEQLLQASHEDVLKEIERVRVLYALKHTMRYTSTRDLTVHSESVAEHVYAMQIIAQYFYPYEDPAGMLDRQRVHELILFHELGEIVTGDIINHRKTEEHRKIERAAVPGVIEQLPRGMQALAEERWEEFEAGETPEARYAIAIDKMEPIFEMWDEKVALPLFKKQNYTREHALGVKKAVTTNFPYMQKFIDAWDHRAVALDIFPA